MDLFPAPYTEPFDKDDIIDTIDERYSLNHTAIYFFMKGHHYAGSTFRRTFGHC